MEIIETKFGKFEIVENYREAFELEKFENKYIEDVFDRYIYVVGDIASELLRLKGFNSRKRNNNSYKHIYDYINESCNANCPYFVLKRIKEEEIITKEVRGE